MCFGRVMSVLCSGGSADFGSSSLVSRSMCEAFGRLVLCGRGWFFGVSVSGRGKEARTGEGRIAGA